MDVRKVAERLDLTARDHEKDECFFFILTRKFRDESRLNDL